MGSGDCKSLSRKKIPWESCRVTKITMTNLNSGIFWHKVAKSRCDSKLRGCSYAGAHSYVIILNSETGSHLNFCFEFHGIKVLNRATLLCEYFCNKTRSHGCVLNCSTSNILPPRKYTDRRINYQLVYTQRNLFSKSC